MAVVTKRHTPEESRVTRDPDAGGFAGSKGLVGGRRGKFRERTQGEGRSGGKAARVKGEAVDPIRGLRRLRAPRLIRASGQHPRRNPSGRLHDCPLNSIAERNLKRSMLNTMNDSEPQVNREDVVAELDAQIGHVTAVLKGRRGSVRRSLNGWKSALEDDRKSVSEGTTTEAQVRTLVHRGCHLAVGRPGGEGRARWRDGGLDNHWRGHVEQRRHCPTIGDPAADAGSTVAMRHHRGEQTGGAPAPVPRR